ncbi:MAG: precorrin-2 C(20)-methyltransferase [Nitrospirae bacterium]|nr:precorrin-2 C(20)-methyltransferase [Nitrospirota bacterium]
MIIDKFIYSLGLGPGDPELVTVKALRIIESADFVVVPQSDELGRSVAKDIVSRYVKPEKILMYYFPMNNKKEELDAKYSQLADKIFDMLSTGANVCYVTMGDPTIFSTSNYLTKKLELKGIEVRHVPGISSITGAASLIGIPICSKGDNFGVYELPPESALAIEYINRHDTTIFMKVNKKLSTLQEAVRLCRPDKAYLARRISLEGEMIYDLLTSTPPADAGYLSIAIVKRKR